MTLIVDLSGLTKTYVICQIKFFVFLKFLLIEIVNYLCVNNYFFTM